MSSTLDATWCSPAKVNLCLRIVGRRPDGYHLLDSIFAVVDLFDRVHLVVHDASRTGSMEIVVRCNHPEVPTDASNLVARAAILLLDACGLRARLTIDIDKRIPPGAGLGGGSSNAATVLLGLIASLQLAVEPERQRQLALQLGADVPFFLTGGCARVQGIGERVEPIRGWPDLSLVVAVPTVAVSTAWAFRHYPPERLHGGDEAHRLATGASPDQSTMVNDLEAVVFPAFPAVARLKERMLSAGASAAVMSGSGSAVVGVAPSPDAAATVARALAAGDEDVRAHAVRVLPGGPFVG